MKTERNALKAFAAERQKAILVHGFGPAHDDLHQDKALARNAGDVIQSHLNKLFAPPPGSDAWGLGAKHHGNPLKLLAIAGGLIAAEYERIERIQRRREKFGIWFARHHWKHDWQLFGEDMASIPLPLKESWQKIINDSDGAKRFRFFANHGIEVLPPVPRPEKQQPI